MQAQSGQKKRARIYPTAIVCGESKFLLDALLRCMLDNQLVCEF
jgi:hypothetical protein